MTNHVHWIRELSLEQFVWGENEDGERAVVMTRAELESIGDYTQSQPTSPSAGRVYRKNIGWWSDKENWYVFLCAADPAEAGYVLHHPYRVLLIDDSPTE